MRCRPDSSWFIFSVGRRSSSSPSSHLACPFSSFFFLSSPLFLSLRLSSAIRFLGSSHRHASLMRFRVSCVEGHRHGGFSNDSLYKRRGSAAASSRFIWWSITIEIVTRIRPSRYILCKQSVFVGLIEGIRCYRWSLI